MLADWCLLLGVFFAVTNSILPAWQMFYLIKDISSNTFVKVKWLEFYSNFVCWMVKFQRANHSDKTFRVVFFFMFESQANFLFKLSKKCSFKGLLVLNDTSR